MDNIFRFLVASIVLGVAAGYAVTKMDAPHLKQQGRIGRFRLTWTPYSMPWTLFGVFTVSATVLLMIATVLVVAVRKDGTPDVVVMSGLSLSAACLASAIGHDYTLWLKQ